MLSWLMKWNSMEEQLHINRIPANNACQNHGPTARLISLPLPNTTSNPHGNQLPPLTFDDIANQLDLYRTKAADCEEQLASFHKKLQDSWTENYRLSKLVQQLSSQNNSLQNDFVKQRNQNVHLQNINRNMKRTGDANVVQIKNQSQRIQSLEKQCANSTVEYQKLQDYTLFVSEKAQDMQLDMELLKCTTDTVDIQTRAERMPLDQMQLTPQPFIVVLVDGDAYGWTHDITNVGAVRSPGALAAIRLKNEVTKHILDSDDIPSWARVVTRVYINGSGSDNTSKKRFSFQNSQKAFLEPFRVQFTEAIPLFDFVDVGHGKERADAKIRENFNLFLPNPHCHRIFLATCTDNGFARMLEPYQYHSTAYEKIVLISPGYIESEIAKLGFRSVIWTSVFAKRQLPQATAKQQKQRAFEDQTRRDMDAHHKRLGLTGIQNHKIATLTMDTVRLKWDGKVIVGGYAGKMALRMIVIHQERDTRSIAEDLVGARHEDDELD